MFLLLRILILQTVEYEKYQAKVISQITTETTIEADRGAIYDANGILLAGNVTTYRVFIAPRTIKEQTNETGVDYADMISHGLSELLEDVTYEDVHYQTTKTHYLDRTIARKVTSDVAKQIRELIKENGLEDMVHLEATATRYYPYDSLAAHTLGFTNSDGVGIYGLEYTYEEYLKGTDGKYVTARDADGNEMPYDYESMIPAVPGYAINTTIDVFVQAALDEQVKAAYIESGGENRACGVVMDVNTGDVLAISVYPTFNLNDPWELNEDCLKALEESGFAEDSEEYGKLSQELLLTTWNNKAVTEVYMPGSTFKIITAAMAVEENLPILNQKHNCPGYHIVNGRKIKCHKVQGHGWLTFAEGIQQSCNPWLMRIGADIGATNFYSYFSAFGYFEKTGIDLPGEGSTVEGVTFWDKTMFESADIYLATASFGQNFKISVLGHVTAIAAVANGGDLVTPRLVRSISDTSGNVIKSFEPEIRRQVVSEQTCQTISKILEEGVSGNGGAKNAYVAGYRIAAKTGTSEKKDLKDEQGNLIDGKYICSTVAYAPADDPQYIIMIMVDQPTQGTLYGSVVAAPYVANVMETILPYLGVEAVYTDAELEKMAIEAPGVTYWSLELAREYAQSVGFELKVVGNGDTIYAQSPEAGVKVEKDNATLIVYTERSMEKKTVKVPDLSGKTAVAASQLLANSNLNIKISGTYNYMSGTVATAYAQSVEPGTEVEIGTTITVYFRDENVADDVENEGLPEAGN
ncbi:MAG: PASTA domain-containing protein [Clostridia bacterium]|nr:PASTA domain-containing protein [Clostridia bacterium]